MKTYELYVGQCQPNVSTVKMNLTVEVHMSLYCPIIKKIYLTFFKIYLISHLYLPLSNTLFQ